MAFDTGTFKTRTLSALIFAIIMLVGLLWNKWSFIALFTLVHFGCWFELIRLFRKMNPVTYRFKSLWGLPYITLPVAAIILIRISPGSGQADDFLKVVPCAIVFSIWINDTMAYIVGSFTGKTPLSTISPKKTWEGTLGGGILCIVVISLIGSLTSIYSLRDWAVISILCAFFGTLGDLLESKIKRNAGVKDSGNLMPGHGGFLDRFDSMLIAIPVVAVYYFLFMVS